MIEHLAAIQWQVFSPLVMVYFIVIAPAFGKFQQLKGHFPRGDDALKKVLLTETVLVLLAPSIALLGILVSTAISNPIVALVVTTSGLLVSAASYALFYVGPLYPYLDELQDAEILADRLQNSNKHQQGT